MDNKIDFKTASSPYRIVEARVKTGEIFDGGWLVNQCYNRNELTKEETGKQVKLALRRMVELRIVDYALKQHNYERSVYKKLR